jgi:hypothetical protein
MRRLLNVLTVLCLSAAGVRADGPVVLTGRKTPSLKLVNTALTAELTLITGTTVVVVTQFTAAEDAGKREEPFEAALTKALEELEKKKKEFRKAESEAAEKRSGPVSPASWVRL